MESKTNYTIVGLFVILLSSALVGVAFWLSTSTNANNYKLYEVYMNEAVAGLSEQAPVRFNGVHVGFVSAIALNPDNPQQVRLLLSINDQTPITTSTVAILKSQGITGISYIGLEAKTSDASPLTVQEGNHYPIIKAEASLLTQIDSTIRDASHTFRELSQTMAEVFDDENAKAIKATLVNLSQVSQTLSDNSDKINSTIINTDKLTALLAQSSEQLPDTMQKLRSTLNNADHTLQSISQQTVPSILDLIQRIDNIAVNLEVLSNELSNNPSVLIRGQQPAALGPGEF